MRVKDENFVGPIVRPAEEEALIARHRLVEASKHLMMENDAPQ